MKTNALTRARAYSTLTHDYLRLDTALRDAYFTVDRAGEPVYLDMDDDVLSRAASTAGSELEEFEDDVVAVVRDNLALDVRGVPMLERFDKALRVWRGEFVDSTRKNEPLPPPPIVAVLAVLTLAAEKMGDSQDSRVHDGAYYTRLCRILSIDASDHERFKTSFRKSTEGYWSALESWLEALDGELGLPSAHSLTYRYVGLPISQALVREAERKDLRRMFEDSGLRGGTSISATEMELALDSWISEQSSHARRNLAHLWMSDARNRIVDIAVKEHESWDGVPRHGRQISSPAVRSGDALVARLAIATRTSLFETTFEMAALLPGDPFDEYTVLTVDGPVPVFPQECGPGLSAIRLGAAGIASDNALSGLFRVNVKGQSRVLARYPRDVVPLTWDAALNLFVESERMAVGERAAILVRAEPELLSGVDQALAEAARPGHTRITGHDHGIPDRWVLYTDVQLTRTPKSVHRQLSVLEPRLRVQMTLSGGFRMPGRITRWSRLQLPEVVVASDEDVDLQVDIQERPVAGEKTQTMTIASGRAPLVVALQDHCGSTGDYTIFLRSGKHRLQSANLRVRSGDEPDRLSWQRTTGLAHVATDALWPLRSQSSAGDLDALLVEGAVAYGPLVPLRAAETPLSDDNAHWSAHAETLTTPEPLRLPLPDRTSCIQTGAHHFQLPAYDQRQKYTAQILIGVCTQCGLTKRYPARYKAASRLGSARASARADVSTLPSLVTSRDWSPAVDALSYLGGGSGREFSGVARQLENTTLFEQTFARCLEALAVIEVSRDDGWSIDGFEVALTGVAETADGAGLFVGNWAPSETAAGQDLALQLGGRIEVVNKQTAHSTRVIVDLDQFSSEFDDIPVVRQAGLQLLRRLPHIGSVVRCLPATRQPLIPGSFELFSPSTARWVSTDTCPRSGAFRLNGRGPTRYLLRLPDEESQRVTSYDLAKHLAGWMANRPLLRYDTARGVLSAPLGAPLPGLYERAAVLQSGQLPYTNRRSATIDYTGVTPDFAAELKVRFK